MKRIRVLLIVSLTGLLASCGGSSQTTPGSSPAGTSGGVTLSTASISGLGTVLVNGAGRTLYIYAPDAAKKVSCTGSCAQVWPPLKIPAGQKPSLSGGVKASLVSSAPDPEGGRVVTYAGWPLYLYVADQAAGTAHGQAINNSGGLWYVMSPDGKVIKKRPPNNGSGY